jgi:hypothetical protein
MAESFAATYLPVLINTLLSDDEDSPSGRRMHRRTDDDDLTPTQLAALEALSRLEPDLLCQHAVPVVLKRLQQYATDQEIAFSVGARFLDGDRGLSALPFANRILKLFALVEGCVALDAHVPSLVSLIQAHTDIGRSDGIGLPPIQDIPRDWDDDEEEYTPSEAEDDESDDEESDEDELDEIDEDYERELLDLRSRPEMTQKAADALSQKIDLKDAVLSLFNSRLHASAVLEGPSEPSKAALLDWVAKVLEASNDWLNVVPENVAAGVVTSWLSAEQNDYQENGNAGEAAGLPGGWVISETLNSWVYGCAIQAHRARTQSSCLLGPQLKQAVTPGAASPWQDLSGELVCKVAKWLLSKPVDAAALSHTSKWMHSCVAPLLADIDVQTRGFLQLERRAGVLNCHRSLVRQLVLKLLAHARPTPLVFHAEALKCFLKDVNAGAQCAAIHVFGRAMQGEGAPMKAR